MEAEFDVLFLYHRLRDVYEILHRFNYRKCQRAELKLSAFDLRDIKDVVDQRKQMIARKTDLP